MKQEIIYFSLNKEKSREYVKNERFREMILSKVKDAIKQIGLTFNTEYKISNIFSEIVVHKIDFGRGYHDLFQNVSSLSYLLPPRGQGDSSHLSKIFLIYHLKIVQIFKISLNLVIKDRHL